MEQQKESREKIQELRREDLKPAKDLESDFKAWEDYILAHQSANVFDELFKVMYAKLTDERINLKNDSSPCQFKARPEEPAGNVSVRIQELLKEGILRWGILQEGEQIKLLPGVLKHIASQMQWYSLLNTPKDILGTAFEYLVAKVLKGERGQYFTPYPVIDMMGKMARVSWDSKVSDIACGSGGFLLWTLKTVWAEIEAKIQDPCQVIKEQNEYANLRLFGLDYEPKLVKIAQVNMLMQGDSRTNIFVEDSLKDETWNAFVKRFIQRNTIDIILTNPPFAGIIENPSILKNFALAYKNRKLLKKQVRPLLFLEMCLNYLRPGGVLAIVLPKGIFNNPTLKYVRDFIRQQTQILACISLDHYVFTPHTGNRAGVLVLKKKKGHLEELLPYEIFMAISQKSGKKQGGKPLYQTTPEGELIYDEQAKPILDSDLGMIAEAYLTKNIPSQVSNQCFWIKSSEIEARIDPEYYHFINNRKLLKCSQHREVTLKPLWNFADYVKRTIAPTKKPLQLFRYIQLDDINEFGLIKQTRKILGKNAPSRAGLLAKEGDIITAMSGSQTGSPNRHRIAIITKEYDNCVVSTGFGILRPKEGIDLYYLYGILQNPYVLGEIHRKLQGGGIPKISEKDLLEILIPEVSPEKQKEIGEIIKAGFQALKEAQNHFMKASNLCESFISEK